MEARARDRTWRYSFFREAATAYAADKELVDTYAHLSLYAAQLPQARARTIDRGHQLNNDLSEVAADIESLR